MQSARKPYQLRATGFWNQTVRVVQAAACDVARSMGAALASQAGCAMPREKEGAHVQEVLHVAAHRYVPDEPGDPPAKAGTALLGPSAELTTGTREEEQTLTRGALSVYKGSALELESKRQLECKQAEDSQLIEFLHTQLYRTPSAENCQLIVNVTQLLARSPHNAPSIISALPIMLSLLQRDAGRARLQEYGLGLFGNLACSEEAHGPLLRSGCLAHVLSSMQQHAESVGVQRNAYRCLRNLFNCADDAEHAVAFMLDHRAVQIAVFMMHRHLGNAEVQTQALACLWSFACHPELGSLLVEIRAADSVVRTLGAHPADVSVQRNGCGALAALLDAMECDELLGGEAGGSGAESGGPTAHEVANAALTAACSHTESVEVQALAMECMTCLATSERWTRQDDGQPVVAALSLATHSAASWFVMRSLLDAQQSETDLRSVTPRQVGIKDGERLSFNDLAKRVRGLGILVGWRRQPDDVAAPSRQNSIISAAARGSLVRRGSGPPRMARAGDADDDKPVLNPRDKEVKIEWYDEDDQELLIIGPRVRGDE